MSDAGQVISATVGALIGFGLGGLAGAARGAALGYTLLSPEDDNSPTYSFGTEYNTSSQVLPVPVVYGYNKVAGNVIYKKVSGEDKDKMDVQVAVSEGPIKNITGVKANAVDLLNIDEKITAEATIENMSRRRDQAPPGEYYNGPDKTTIELSPDVDYSEWEGHIVRGKDTRFESVVDRVFDENKIIIYRDIRYAGIGDTLVFERTNDLAASVKIRTKLGNRTQSVDSINEDGQSFPYVAYISAELEANEQLSGNPAITSIIEGRKVDVWNGSSWVNQYSQNPAYCLLDFMTNKRYGLGISKDDIDLDSFIDAAEYCNDGVEGKPHGWVSPRFELNYVIDFQKSCLDHIQDMLACFRGFLVYSNGEFRLKIDKPESVTQVFDMDNIAAKSFSYEKTSKKDRYNKVVVEYIEPTNEWAMMGAEYVLRKDIAKNGVNDKKLPLRGINSFDQASRLAKYYQKKSWYCNTFCSFKVGIDSLHCEAGDVISVSHDLTEWVDKKFRILQIREEENDEMVLVCQEYNEAIYSDDGEIEQIVSDNTLPSPFEKPEHVTNVQATENHKKLKDGTWIPTMTTTWDLPAEKIFWKYGNIYISNNDGASWKFQGKTEEQEFTIDGLETGDYLVKVQSENKNGFKSDFENSPTYSITINGKTGISEDPVVANVNGGIRQLDIFMEQPAEKDWAGFEVYVGENSGFTPDTTDYTNRRDKGKKLSFSIGRLFAGVTYYAKIRMYDESDNYSDFVEASGTPAGETTTATLTIAAHDSNPKGRAGADYVCDGISDQVQINDAINNLPTGGKILLLEGTYIVNDSIILKDRITLTGNGENTTLKIVDGYDNDIDVIKNHDAANGNTEIKITNFKIDGNVDNIIIEENNMKGISLVNVTLCKINNMTIENIDSEGIILDSCTRCSIIENSLTNIKGPVGININSNSGESTKNTINNNTVEDCFRGIDIFFSENIIVANNDVSNSTESGIRIINTNNSIFNSNTSYGNGYHGIYVNGDNNAVQGNNCWANNQLNESTYISNILIQANYNNVQNNICRAGNLTYEPIYGIYILSGDGNYVTNNDLYNSGSSANFRDDGTGTITTAGNRT